MDTERHVVVGAGTIGTAVTRLLTDQGRSVRLITRGGSGPDHPAVELIAADAGDAATLTEIGRDAVAIYNCANPSYHRWVSDWPPIAASLLRAAEVNGAVLATCSNLYGYGPVDGPMTEDLPLAATGRKGQVRAQMWRDALAAHEAGRVRATEVRASDYLGPRGAQSDLGDRVLPRMLAGKDVRVLGEPDAPHSWTYTDDVARLLVTVAADARAWGRPWHVPSNPPRSVRELLTDLAAAAGVDPVAVRRLPGALLRIGGIFSPLLRELPEVMYQHERSWILDSEAATQMFGLEPTPWPAVVAAVLESHRTPARPAPARA